MTVAATRKLPLFNSTVYGRLIDRYLFNFRADPDALREKLAGLGWLEPEIVNGYGVVSFCLLRLEGVSLWPLPSALGIDSTSCAFRCAVIDCSSGRDEPSVFVFRRYTSLPFVSRVGSLLFSSPIRLISSSVLKGSSARIRAVYPDGRPLFAADTTPYEGSEESSPLFDSTDDFVRFIKGGMSSYTPSNHVDRYSRVDLVEDSNYYEPFRASIRYNLLGEMWSDAKLTFDSCFHATGGRYVLRYMGTTSANSQGGPDNKGVLGEAA